jgi:hypothetical protein
LQVILSRADLAIHSMPELEDIIGAVNRIDWALREILPRGATSADRMPDRNSST